MLAGSCARRLPPARMYQNNATCQPRFLLATGAYRHVKQPSCTKQGYTIITRLADDIRPRAREPVTSIFPYRRRQFLARPAQTPSLAQRKQQEAQQARRDYHGNAAYLSDRRFPLASQPTELIILSPQVEARARSWGAIEAPEQHA